MFKNDCRFVNSAVGPVHAITFSITLGTHGAYKTFLKVSPFMYFCHISFVLSYCDRRIKEET